MPTGIFPYIGSYGNENEFEVDEFIREYDNGDVGVNPRAAVSKDRVTLRFNNISKVKRNAIVVFWKAHKLATTYGTKTFYFYNPQEATQVDIDTDSGTGKYIGIFVDPKLNIGHSGRCRFSGTINIRIVAA